MAALVRVNKMAVGMVLPAVFSMLRMSRMAFTASAASSRLPWVGTMTRSARLIAYPTIKDAVPSRSTTTKAALREAWSIWSRMASSVTSATTARLAGFPGRFAQRERGLLGSASMTATFAPCPASSVARMTAEVDFPAPPLGLAKTMVGMAGPRRDPPSVIKGRLLMNGKQLADCLRLADCRQIVDSERAARCSQTASSLRMRKGVENALRPPLAIALVNYLRAMTVSPGRRITALGAAGDSRKNDAATLGAAENFVVNESVCVSRQDRETSCGWSRSRRRAAVKSFVSMGVAEEDESALTERRTFIRPSGTGRAGRRGTAREPPPVAARLPDDVRTVPPPSALEARSAGPPGRAPNARLKNA